MVAVAHPCPGVAVFLTDPPHQSEHFVVLTVERLVFLSEDVYRPREHVFPPLVNLAFSSLLQSYSGHTRILLSMHLRAGKGAYGNSSEHFVQYDLDQRWAEQMTWEVILVLLENYLPGQPEVYASCDLALVTPIVQSE